MDTTHMKVADCLALVTSNVDVSQAMATMKARVLSKYGVEGCMILLMRTGNIASGNEEEILYHAAIVEAERLVRAMPLH